MAYQQYMEGDLDTHSWNYSDEGVILRKQAVCAGYAQAFLRMCRYAGLKCEYILSGQHAWNLVKVGGKWYHYDVTWNDCVNSQTRYSFMGPTQAAKDAVRRNWTSHKTSAFLKAHPVSSTSLKW